MTISATVSDLSFMVSAPFEMDIEQLPDQVVGGVIEGLVAKTGVEITKNLRSFHD
jgi:hypothetical protein